MVGYKLSKNDWVTPFFVIFRSVREILLVTVFCKHPVPTYFDGSWTACATDVQYWHETHIKVQRPRLCTLSPLCVYLRSNRQLIFRDKFNATTNKQKNVLKTLRPLVESLWTINLDFVSKQMIHEEQRKHYLAQNIETLKCNSESVKCKSKIEIWNNATLWLSPNQQHEFVKKM